jgi:hypothetical protein
MAITDSFRKAVAAGDVKGLRIMMKNSLLVDPTFAEFNEMDSLARGVSGLYEGHDGSGIKVDKSAWNDDYMDRQMVQVVGNFSHERIEHLKEVVRYLRPAAAHQKQGSQENRSGTRQTTTSDETQHEHRSYWEQRRQDQRFGGTTSDRAIKIAGGAVGGGVAGAVIAGIFKGPVIIGALAGAVVAGAIVAIVTKDE